MIAAALLFAQAAADPSALARGERIFAQSCSVGYCHGVAGAAGRGPRLRGRSLSKDYLYTVTRDGIQGSAMPPWKSRLTDDQIRAVVEYVASLSSGTETAPPANPMPPGAGPASLPSFNGPPQAGRGRALFSDPIRESCAVCHTAGGRGLAIGPELTAASGRSQAEVIGLIHATESRHVLKATLQSGEQFFALPVSQTSDEVRLYDLTLTPPVLRTLSRSQVVSLGQSQAWRHEDYTQNYTPSELQDVLTYLRWVAAGQ
jgi:mono/diheme cytochrome c family protein